MSEDREIGKYLALNDLEYLVANEIEKVRDQLDAMASWAVDEDTWYSGYIAALRWVGERIRAEQ